MIISCPMCSTRYTVPDSAVGPEGKKVRCTHCGHTWYEYPQHGPVSGPSTVAVEDEDLDAVDEAFRTIRGRSAAREEPPASRRGKAKAGGAAGGAGGGRRRVVGWLVLALLVAGLGAGGVLAREELVRLWPPAALLYETVGLPVEPPGTGLQLQNVRSEQREDGGAPVLVVEGQIVNVSEQERAVPDVVAVSLGPDRRPVSEWLIEVSSNRLLPGEIATFHSARRDPGAVAEVMITFEGR